MVQKKNFHQGVTALEVAVGIGLGLAKSTVSAQVNGTFIDGTDRS
jgi:hypothetical protein